MYFNYTDFTKTTILSLLVLIFLNFSSSCIAQHLPTGFPNTKRTKLSLNQDWKFHLGNPEAKYYQKDFDDTNWENVNVPHTLALTSLTLDDLKDDKTQLIFHRDVGWYRKTFEVKATANQKVFIEFEGAHQVTDLWINGKHVGQHSIGGYTPFHFDITDFIIPGEQNQMTLLVDNRRNEVVPPDPGPFDYVKFSGLYRDVYLVQTDLMHITFNWESLTAGINITTPTIDPVNKNATIDIKTVVRNEYPETKKCELITRIIDARGIVVLKLEESAEIKSDEDFEFNQIGGLEDDVKFWDTENPYLYRVNSLVKFDGKAIDFQENKLGLRKFELDPIRGFVLNNKPIELIGMNRHQQFPYVGDAVPDALHYKDMLQFKEFGFNIMRTAHYPQDNAIIEACDELGILVYEEAPTWISVSQNDKWWDNFEKSARVMIRNHRNHPSVVIWGAGVNHRGYVPRAHNTVKQEDPTRLTASQGARWTGWQASGLTDINANMLYGPFIWDRSEPLFAMEGGVGPKAVAPQKRDVLMLGLISWTAHAYYTFHPSHAKAESKIDRTRSGGMTIFRYPRPELDWYKSELLPAPFISIQEDWKEGTESLSIYSNGDEVELFLNGKSLGKQKPVTDSVYIGLDHPPFVYKNIKFEEGILTAKAFRKGEIIATAKKLSPLKPTGVQLVVDTLGRSFFADGSDILMVYAHVVDKNGTTVSETDHLIKFSVEGDASVIGDKADINANPMFTEYGVAPVLIKSGTTPGKIQITATSKGLKKGSALVQTIPFNPDRISANAQPIYDFKNTRIDLGAQDQLVQFSWNPWYGEDNQKSSYEPQLFEGVKINIAPASENGIIRWLGEMNVIGKYGFAYGDGVIAIDEGGLNLVFENLPEGNYRLKTWHHAPRSNSDEMDPNKDKLKTLTIPSLPYEKDLTISSDNFTAPEPKKVKVTEGQNMQFDAPGTHEVIFNSDGKNPVIINFKGNQNKGIWLNAIEISEWF